MTVKPTSLSGIANRYIDLQLGPDDGRDIEDGGRIGPDQTATAVELDEVFALFDEETRGSLRDFIKGQADTLRGRGAELREGIHYLNPALSTGSRAVRRADPRRAAAERFVVDSASLVNALAERPRRPDRGRLEPQRHVRRAREPAGRAGRVDRAAAAVPAARRTRRS